MIRLSLVILAVLSAIGIFTYCRIRSAANLLLSTTDLNSWHWEQGSPAVSGGVKVEDDALRIDVIKTDGMDWHLQLYQAQATLKEGQKYRFSFVGKASVTRTITAIATAASYLGTGGGELGLNADFTLDNQWKEQETTFYAKGADGRFDRVPIIYFGVGPPATVWLKDIRLEQIN